MDGPAIFDGCANCQVAVACQQFQAKGCDRCQFGLYCATGPTLSGCTAIKVSCWSGAYPGLTAHFAAAQLDPTKNQWNKVYDGSAGAEADAAPNFELSMEPAPTWEAPVEGAAGAAANPVPGPDGAPQLPAAASASASGGDDVDAVTAGLQATDLAAEPTLAAEAAAFPVENGNHQQPSAEAAAGYGVEPPSTADARDALQTRLEAQARKEFEQKAALQSAASRYLQEFYESRNAGRDARIRAGRDELARRGSGEAGPEGSSQWERAISMIDFNMSRPAGTDLSRFKAVLLACKERAPAKPTAA